ncbi:MAG TPA: GNAT family N-acetyltransferase [Bacteroidales bacterium]|nr:GNAT family N-acetyltransferase [Bacteroidales bacterium]
MNITIKKAEEKDFPAILSLIKKLAEYEREPEKVTNSVALMKEEQEHFRCFVAETENGEIVGMALYFFAYFTWVGKSLYLEDIFVEEQFRRYRIGSSLLNKIFEVAKEENCKRVRWQVLDWNSDAIAFYRKRGAEINNKWLNCTFDRNGIINFNV